MFFIKLLRVHHWTKNILLFIPLILSQNLDSSLYIKTLFGFLCFSLIASAGYIINDLIDLEYDKKNEDRKNRIIASGRISFLNAIFIIFFLLLISLSLSFYYLNYIFIFYLLIYLIIVSLYSYFFKKIIIIDIIILALFYIYRIILGAQITDTTVSSWLLFFSLFIFIFLALNKRIVEIQSFENNNILFKQNYNRGYLFEDLNILKIMSITSGFISIFVLSIYFNFSKNINYYENIYFSFSICLLLLIWVMRLIFLTNRKFMNYDPIIFSLRDSMSWVIGFLIIIIYIFNL